MITVAVLRGGSGGQHDISLKTGATVIESLSRVSEGRGLYRAIDVFIDKGGAWHVRGIPVAPERALAGADVAFNALHGSYGEGQVQTVLERAGISYVGAGAYPATAALNKRLAKDILRREGVRMPMQVILKVSPDLEREAMAAFRSFSPPVIVKPVSSGSSVGVTLAKDFHEFWDGLKEAFAHSKEALVEDYIAGKEASSGVIENFRGDALYTLLPAEIPLPGFSIFDHEAKRAGTAPIRSPGNFTGEESAEIARLARLAHERLGLRHYSRSDFIVSPRGVYFLEANPLPAFFSGTPFAASLAAAGIATDDFLQHLIGLALPASHPHV